MALGAEGQRRARARRARATSRRRRAAAANAPRTSTRCRSTPTSSAPWSRTRPATRPAAAAGARARGAAQPASPEAWRRLGEYYLNQLSQPGAGDARCCGPRSTSTRSRSRTAATTSSRCARSRSGSPSAGRRAGSGRAGGGRTGQREAGSTASRAPLARDSLAPSSGAPPQRHRSSTLAAPRRLESERVEQRRPASGACRTAAPAPAGRSGARRRTARSAALCNAAVIGNGDREHAARAQHPPHLGHQELRVGDVLEHVDAGDGVERARPRTAGGRPAPTCVERARPGCAARARSSATVDGIGARARRAPGARQPPASRPSPQPTSSTRGARAAADGLERASRVRARSTAGRAEATARRRPRSSSVGRLAGR